MLSRLIIYDIQVPRHALDTGDGQPGRCKEEPGDSDAQNKGEDLLNKEQYHCEIENSDYGLVLY